MQKRRFGRIGLRVSIVGFGGTWISKISLDEAVKVVRKAFELGINYFDTVRLGRTHLLSIAYSCACAPYLDRASSRRLHPPLRRRFL